MSWTAITGTGGSLVVSTPPKVLERDRENGPKLSEAISITGRLIVSEVTQTQNQQHLHWRWEYMSGSNYATLRAIKAAGGVVTIKASSAATGVVCHMLSLKAEPGIGDDYPDTLSDGSVQLAARTWQRVDIIFGLIA